MLLGKSYLSAAVVIPHHNKEIFLQLRDNKKGIFYPNHWGCFGGALENNEFYIQAAIREFYEETNIVLKKTKLKLFISKEYHIKKFKFKRKYFIYKLSNKKLFLNKFILNEGKMGEFISLKNFYKLKNVCPYDKFAIDYFFENIVN